jgi:hypothetical protein
MKTLLQTKHHYSVFLIVFLMIGLILFSCGKQEKLESYFPETGKAAIHHRALELASNLNVLSIALEPGFEDLSTLAYFRLEKGAKIMSAYLTNGEAGDSDVLGEYPNYLAATRRTEAAEALYYLDGNIHYLNFPHIVAARDTGKIREKWIKSEVEVKIIELINQFRPDVILVARDWVTDNKSLRWNTFRNDILSAVKKTELPPSDPNKEDNWRVARVLIDDLEMSAKELPVENLHPIYKKSYNELGKEAGLLFKSLSVQRPTWRDGKNEKYSIYYPSKNLDLKQPDAGLPLRHSKSLDGMAQKIQSLSGTIFKGKTNTVSLQLVAILDSINFKIASWFNMPIIDQRAMFHWKESLEKLQCSLLGIKVNYSTDENILTNVQLIRIIVNDVEGFEVGDKTSIFFGGLEQKWIINESKEKRVKLRLGDDYRLISPEELNYTTPQAKYGLQLARVDKPITLMILHNAPTKEKSFIYRTNIKLYFAPKFSTEVLTPVVRIIPGEQVILRLTNHSRDGVRDTVRVVHEIAESVPGQFRLNEKEATQLDSLMLIWNQYPEAGTYRLPIKLGAIQSGTFAARSFSVRVDSSKRIGLIPSLVGSPLLPTMTRLGLKYTKIDPDKNLSKSLENLDVVFIDRRALTLHKNLISQKEKLDNFVKNGGHLIYLSQDAAVWNESQIWADILLSGSQKFDETFPLTADKNHPFLKSPNIVEDGDWEEWLFQRAYNTIEVKNNTNISMPIQADDQRSPFVLTKQDENGRITYIDLAISQQLLNIHPGVFVLLANIISI